MDSHSTNANPIEGDSKTIPIPSATPELPTTTLTRPSSARPNITPIHSYSTAGTATNTDPYSLADAKREDISIATLRKDHPKQKAKVKKIKSFYSKQNALIDAYLGSNDEEAAEAEDVLQNGWKVKFAVNASSTVNFCLFVIQVYAAVSTGSLALFATAADAFVRLHLGCWNQY